MAHRVYPVSGDDTLLATAYAHAIGLVYPSRLEGFGFPLLEAMSLSTPVYCSDIPIFREVAGPAAYLADTTNEDTIVETLEDFVGNETRRAALVAAGIERVKIFNRASNLAAHRAVYDAVAAG